MMTRQELKSQCIYLNNLIPDNDFINMVYNEKKVEYYESYDPEGDDEYLMDYITTTETMFYKYGVSFTGISQNF